MRLRAPSLFFGLTMMAVVSVNSPIAAQPRTRVRLQNSLMRVINNPAIIASTLFLSSLVYPES